MRGGPCRNRTCNLTIKSRRRCLVELMSRIQFGSTAPAQLYFPWRSRVNTPACLVDRMICETSLESVEDIKVKRADVPQPVTYSNGAMASVAACLGRSYSVVLAGPNI